MTMTFVFALVGLLVGGVIGEVGGALGGAALGYAIGLHLSFKNRIAALEDDIARLARERETRDAPPVPDRPWLQKWGPAPCRDYFEPAASAPAQSPPATPVRAAETAATAEAPRPVLTQEPTIREEASLKDFGRVRREVPESP